MLESKMMPFIWMRCPGSFKGPLIPVQNRNVRADFQWDDHLTWEQLTVSAMCAILNKYGTTPPYNDCSEFAPDHCLKFAGHRGRNPADVLRFAGLGTGNHECKGLVLKSTDGTYGNSVTFVLAVEGPPGQHTLEAKTITGEVLAKPSDWMRTFHYGGASGCAKVKFEIYNPRIRDSEYRTLTWLRMQKNGLRFTKLATAKTNFDAAGKLSIGPVVGLLNEQDSKTTNAIDYSNTSVVHYKKFKINAIYDKVIIPDIINSASPIVYSGTMLRIDYSIDRYRLSGKNEELTISEVTTCPVALSLDNVGTSHWFISHNMAKALIQFMNEYWGKWPQ
jgi:hypothetical protein